MKVELHNTATVVELIVSGVRVPARIWEGTTETGIPITAFITRIAVDRQEDTAECERELLETSPSSVEAEHWPARMVLG